MIINQEKYHTFWNRFFAIIIDGLILTPLEWFDTYILSGSISSIGIIAWGMFYSIIGVFYYVFMHAKYGQTIGKMITKVKVLDVSEERNIDLQQACLRDIVPILLIPLSIYFYIKFAFYGLSWENLDESTWLFYIGYILIGWVSLEIVSMLFNDKRRAVHDYIAGSVVVKQT